MQDQERLIFVMRLSVLKNIERFQPQMFLKMLVLGVHLLFSIRTYQSE